VLEIRLLTRCCRCGGSAGSQANGPLCGAQSFRPEPSYHELNIQKTAHLDAHSSLAQKSSFLPFRVQRHYFDMSWHHYSALRALKSHFHTFALQSPPPPPPGPPPAD
jgi:hypothetical protein